MARPERIIMFHGTSDRFLDDIVARGTDPRPARRLSDLMAQAADGATGHTLAFDGTYFTACHSTAVGYAVKAVEHFGAGPLVVSVSLPVATLVPDEDEVLFALGYPLAWAMGFDAEDPGKPLNRVDAAVALEAAKTLCSDFGFEGEEPAATVGTLLHRMVGPVTGKSWDGSPRLFDPDFNEGWSSPGWVRRLTSVPRGMALYRQAMDEITRAMAGADPWSYPAQIESCKGRMLAPVRVGGEPGAGFIVGLGTPDEPFGHFDGRDLIRADDEIEHESRQWLDGTLPRRGLAA